MAESLTTNFVIHLLKSDSCPIINVGSNNCAILVDLRMNLQLNYF